MEQELSCSICRDLFRNPVFLSCSHSFCKDCLLTWWENKVIRTCPFCKKRSKRYANGPPLNLALKNAVEVYKQQRASEHPECSFHSEKLRLFCLDHEELACVICKDSNIHTGHRFIPINEVASNLREQLRNSLQPLQDKLKVLNERRVQFDDTVAHIAAQAERAKLEMRRQFQKLHLFLWREETTRNEALKEEKEQKTKKMKDQMAAVSRDIEAVSQTISEIEKQLRAADASFLLHCKTAVEKVERCYLVPEPEMEFGALINQTAYLGNLRFKVWAKMKSLVRFYPVLLDSNTAAPNLIISKNLRSVSTGESQKIPANPERYSNKAVCGSGFVSGTRSFVVDVSHSKTWLVGVIGNRDRKNIWVSYSNNNYTAKSGSGICKRLSLKNIHRVRVKLSFDRKTVTFTDPETNVDLHTDTLFGEVRPVLLTDASLKILPMDISQVELNSAPQPDQFSVNRTSTQ